MQHPVGMARGVISQRKEGESPFLPRLSTRYCETLRNCVATPTIALEGFSFARSTHAGIAPALDAINSLHCGIA